MIKYLVTFSWDGTSTAIFHTETEAREFANARKTEGFSVVLYEAKQICLDVME